MAPDLRPKSEYEVISDYKTVWVNDQFGCCIGRFSSKGVDVHRTGSEQLAGLPECLDCVHEGDPFDLWARFKASMLTYHRVLVGDQHKPRFVP